MYWLITFSRTLGNIVTKETIVSRMDPGEYFLDLEKYYPQTINNILFAIEIREEHFYKILHEMDK